MPLELRPVNGAFHIVDTDIPGGALVEDHAEEARAQARLAVLAAERGGAVEGAAGMAEELAAMLEGRAGEVRDRVRKLADADVLAALQAQESDGLGRATVLNAIAARLERLAG